MPLEIKYICDICNQTMITPDDGLDPHRYNDVKIQQNEFRYVCNDCIIALNDVVLMRRGDPDHKDSLRKIQNDVNLRCSIFKEYMIRKSKIDAIRNLRLKTEIGLREAKDIVEYWYDNVWSNM